MQLTDEQFATLAPYEAHFTTALRSSYPRSPGRLALKTIHAVLRELEPTTPALNTTCGTCIPRVLKKAGTLYFEKKERDAAQDALAVLATKEAEKRPAKPRTGKAPGKTNKARKTGKK